MSAAIHVLAQIRTAEPWTVPGLIGGVLLLLGCAAVIIGLLARTHGRR
jgi:hypothetical protein